MDPETPATTTKQDPPAARPMLLACAAALLGAALLPLSPAPATAQLVQAFTPAEAVSLPKGEKVTSFDISFDDWQLQLYFLADRTNRAIDVVDTSNSPTQHTVIAQLASNPPFAGPGGAGPGTAGPNGVVTVGPPHREIWVGDYDTLDKTGVVKVINLRTGETTHVIPTGGGARAGRLCYDPVDNMVLVANDSEAVTSAGGAPFDSLISTISYEVVRTIRMNGSRRRPLATSGIGQCQWDQTSGDFFQTIPEVNGSGNDTAHGDVLEISPHSLSIVARFKIPLSDCAGPQGIALGAGRQALLGCGDPNATVPSSVVIDLDSGAVVQTVRREDGADEVWYDPNVNDYLLGIGSGRRPGRLGVVNAQTLARQPSFTSGAGAHSVAVDNIFDEVYVPIPSTGGTDICSSVAISPGVDANGCIMVYTDPVRRKRAASN